MNEEEQRVCCTPESLQCLNNPNDLKFQKLSESSGGPFLLHTTFA
jgi:hypothetical protein